MKHKILILVISAAVIAFAEESRKIEFSEQQIEGKIRRPQLVLIKAEQRPDFPPMVMKSLGGNANIVEFVTPGVIVGGPYENAFKFNGEAISSYAP